MAAVSNGLGSALSATEAPEQDVVSRSGLLRYALAATAFHGWSTGSVRGGLSAGDSYWFVVAFVALLGGLMLIVEALAQPNGIKVASIEIRGNKKIELQAITGRLTLKAGDPYTPENVRGQIKILYETGYFETSKLRLNRRDKVWG